MAKVARIGTAGLVVTLVMRSTLVAAAAPSGPDQSPSRAAIILQAGDQAGVPIAVLGRAKEEVARIYWHAGVLIEWEDDLPRPARQDVRHLSVVIVPLRIAGGMAVNPTAMGVAVTSHRIRGRLVYIFYNRVEQVAADANVDLARMLGHVVAHEIGHLLLPPGHSPTGLMRADWHQDDFREALQGRLLFTDDQAAQIRAGLAGDAKRAFLR